MSSLREQASSQFQLGNFSLALELYDQLLTQTVDSKEKSVLLGNKALCLLRLDRAKEALEQCDKAIGLGDVGVKVLYRRAQAQLKLGDDREAVLDLKMVLNMDPGNTEAQSLLRSVHLRLSKSTGDDYESLIAAIKAKSVTKDSSVSKDITSLMNMYNSDTSVQLKLHPVLISLLMPCLNFCPQEVIPALEKAYDYYSAHVSDGKIDSSVFESQKQFLFSFIKSNDPLSNRLSFLIAKYASIWVNCDIFQLFFDTFTTLLSSTEVNRVEKIMLVMQIFCNLAHLDNYRCVLLQKLFPVLIDFSWEDRFMEARIILLASILKKTETPSESLSQALQNAIILLNNLASKRSQYPLEALKCLSAVLQAAPHVIPSLLVDDTGNSSNIVEDLVELFECKNDTLQSIAAENIALLASESSVRTQLVNDDKWDMLLFLIDRCDSDVIKINAALALSKLAVLNDAVRADVFKDSIVKLVMDIFQKNNFENQKLCLEVIAHLSMHYEIKVLLVNEKGSWFTQICNFIPSFAKTSFDRVVLYSVLQILCNMATSSSELEASNTELEQLKKVASKGLNLDKYSRMPVERAGTPEIIDEVRGKMLSYGAMSTLYHIMNHLLGGYHQSSTKLEISTSMIENITTVFMVLSLKKEYRGLMVQQGAMTILLKLYELTYSPSHPEVDASSGTQKLLPWMKCTVALARIVISVNPTLFPRSILPSSLIKPLALLAECADHELYQFECILALTNLCSIADDDSLSSSVLNNNVWGIVRSALGSPTTMLTRAAIECMTNLTLIPKIAERLEKDEADLKLFILFSKSDDPESQIAALGALAMLSNSLVIAKKLIELDYLKFVQQIKTLESQFSTDLMLRVNAILENLHSVSRS